MLSGEFISEFLACFMQNKIKYARRPLQFGWEGARRQPSPCTDRAGSGADACSHTGRSETSPLYARPAPCPCSPGPIPASRLPGGCGEGTGGHHGLASPSARPDMAARPLQVAALPQRGRAHQGFCCPLLPALFLLS